jgi:hypothetical protein
MWSPSVYLPRAGFARVTCHDRTSASKPCVRVRSRDTVAFLEQARIRALRILSQFLELASKFRSLIRERRIPLVAPAIQAPEIGIERAARRVAHPHRLLHFLDPRLRCKHRRNAFVQHPVGPRVRYYA